MDKDQSQDDKPWKKKIIYYYYFCVCKDAFSTKGKNLESAENSSIILEVVIIAFTYIDIRINSHLFKGILEEKFCKI